MPPIIPYAFVSLVFVLGFRLTCYYYRKAYYRAFWRAPSACAVREPHAKYTGETRFPLIAQNVHRYFWYAAAVRRRSCSPTTWCRRSTAGRELRLRPRVADPAGQRDLYLGLHAGLPLVPAHHRRPAEALLQAPGPVLGLDLGLLAERAAHAVRLDLAGHADADRPLHPARWPAGPSPIRGSSTDRTGSGMTRHRTSLLRRRGRSAPAAPGCARRSRPGWHGKKTAIISKSLFGKAHTVMAEGGCAAAMGNVNPNDNWQVHFRDTMRGGKFLNNWRMAELHAKEAPDRVWELEAWGALFDRTKDGKISQRNFGGHEYPRLAHVGDRTGLELIRTLQQKIVALQQEDAAEHGDPEAMIKVFAETTITELLQGRRRGSPGRSATSATPASSCSSRRRRWCWPPAASARRSRSPRNSWEYTGDGHALALLRRGDPDQHGVRAVPPDRHGLAAVGARACWSPSRSAVTAACCATPRASGSCSTTCPTCSAHEYAETEEEADRWYTDQDNNRRPPELLPRDEVARCDQHRGQGRPRVAARRRVPRHRVPAARPRRSCAGCRRCTTSSRSWPTSTSPRSRWRSARPATT